MESLNEQIRDYTVQLRKGHIQKAYRGIMAFMSGLSAYLESKYPDYTASALYFGYMDMTYFAFTPDDLRRRKLKIAIVYLHEQGRFEIWLGAGNRKIQGEYIGLMSGRNIAGYKLSRAMPGAPSILESVLTEQPDFDHPEELKKLIEGKASQFIADITSLLQ